ncbi:hypothetical protein KQX54_018421 [Cotesia glomerata]|uniref:Uncharacterized protein n=1 Tax=Cotesia glomerata TaxID=32391 RepID=A0AAV7IN03_COTGL|nr:hypothetical protein KQX54_018421 [Cotesia glomerata]
MYALVFWPKEKTTSVIQSKLINKRLEANRATVRWGRKYLSAFIIAESKDIVWLESLIVNTCGIIIGYSDDRLKLDASVQFSSPSIGHNGTMDNFPGRSSDDFHIYSVAAAASVNQTTTPTTTTVPVTPVTFNVDHPAALTTSMVPDSSATFVVNRTVTLPVSSTPNNAAVSTFHQTSTPNASTTLDVVVSSAVDRKATLTISTTPKDVAASVIYRIANKIVYIFRVVVNVVAAAIDYTTASTSTDTTSTESTCPSNRPTVNQAMVELTEGSNVHIERLKLQDVLRFKNKPNEMTRRLLRSILGAERLKHLTLTEIHSNLELTNILNTIESFTQQNTCEELQLTNDKFNRCVTLFLYNLKNPKK